MKRIAVAATCAALVLGAPTAASAHVLFVTTPSGETHAQFLGGPGNPGHPGHHGGPSGQGHTQACEGAEDSGVVDFWSPFGSCA